MTSERDTKRPPFRTFVVMVVLVSTTLWLLIAMAMTVDTLTQATPITDFQRAIVIIYSGLAMGMAFLGAVYEVATS